jgi:hypothetical protein
MTRQLRVQAARDMGARAARAEQWRVAREGWCAGVYYDLRTLVTLRGARNDGHRERTLFWAGNFGLRAGLLTGDNMLDELGAWAQLMPRPEEMHRELRGGCVTTLLQRARAGDLYRARRVTLVKDLEIDGDELAQLPTLGRRAAPAGVRTELRDGLTRSCASRSPARRSSRSRALSVLAGGAPSSTCVRTSSHKRNLVCVFGVRARLKGEGLLLVQFFGGGEGGGAGRLSAPIQF